LPCRGLAPGVCYGQGPCELHWHLLNVAGGSQPAAISSWQAKQGRVGRSWDFLGAMLGGQPGLPGAPWQPADAQRLAKAGSADGKAKLPCREALPGTCLVQRNIQSGIGEGGRGRLEDEVCYFCAAWQGCNCRRVQPVRPGLERCCSCRGNRCVSHCRERGAGSVSTVAGRLGCCSRARLQQGHTRA
jgi:hypothetical protein